MKNKSDIVYTHKVEWKDKENFYFLNLDVDYKIAFINGISFSGPFSSKDSALARQLEDKISNIKIEDLQKIVNEESEISIPVLLLLKFYKEYFGIIVVPRKNELVCLCYGVSKADIENFAATKEGSDFFGEMMSTLLVATSCGDCLRKVQDIYVDCASTKKPTEALQTFPELKGRSYSQLIIEIDDVLKDYLKDLGRDPDEVIIQSIKNFEIELKSKDTNFLRDHQLLLTQLIFRRVGIFAFFH